MATVGPPKIDVTTATIEELQQVIGIGPKIAQSIV
ncbi:MAG: helix-hairpin-helix domain-containing protein, partial [Sedimenticola sp.]